MACVVPTNIAESSGQRFNVEECRRGSRFSLDSELKRGVNEKSLDCRAEARGEWKNQ